MKNIDNHGRKIQVDNFVNIPFAISNLDRYLVRSSVLKAITETLPQFSGRMLDAGCGGMPYRKYILDNSKVTEYVGLDIEQARTYNDRVKPDFTWDGKTMPFADQEFDCIIATEVLEHCPEPELFLREINRVMKKGGKFFFTVPFLWNLHEVPHDEYRYTPFALERHLKNCGFSGISIFAMGGWHASMAQMLGLWVRRAPMNKFLKNVLSVFVKPLMALLIRIDQKKSRRFREGLMITGLYGTVQK